MSLVALMTYTALARSKVSFNTVVEGCKIANPGENTSFVWKMPTETRPQGSSHTDLPVTMPSLPPHSTRCLALR